MDRGAWQAAAHGIAKDLATKQQQKLLAHVKFIVLFLDRQLGEKPSLVLAWGLCPPSPQPR